MNLIVATDPTGGIGYQNKLPWKKLDGDLPRFKLLTQGKNIIMGRQTWESLPFKPLPNRINYIVSSNPLAIQYENVKVIKLDEAKEIKNAYIIGGAKLINGLWNYITEIHLTRTHMPYICDTYINLIKLEKQFLCWFKETFKDHNYEIWKRKNEAIS